jgi:hypothetical protein
MARLLKDGTTVCGDDGARRAVCGRALCDVRGTISGNRRRIWTGAWYFPSLVCHRIVRRSGSRHLCLPFVLAGGRHATVSRATDQFLEECGPFGVAWCLSPRRRINRPSSSGGQQD